MSKNIVKVDILVKASQNEVCGVVFFEKNYFEFEHGNLKTLLKMI